ncbi:anti-sigma factor family protein [Thetidibacter halocola]|uniref:Zf-HC2 domain-containing protein n=1 Tax=Thetidibacter halocola TaxID=2827239 RepID=A0A8J8BA63_9RHOB|nr:zf-HC2 domain-containing protein [Thetidibacter halocola]MBS0124863.1 zf-HC2 domain-containing protein [Thetidibacter halocola]
MTRTMMDKERLAAFADGELSPEDAAAVVMHLSDHPEDQAYVDDLMAANAALAQAFSAPLAEPVPTRLLAAAGMPGANVIPFRRRVLRLGAGGLALAASVAAAALLVWPGADTRLVPGAVAGGSPLAQALDSLPSGVPATLEGRALMILASLPVQDGFCREVEIVDSSASLLEMALACRGAGGWRVEVVLAERLPETTENGYVPAGGVETAGLTPFLDRLGAGLALSPQDEQAAIAAGWKR